MGVSAKVRGAGLLSDLLGGRAAGEIHELWALAAPAMLAGMFGETQGVVSMLFIGPLGKDMIGAATLSWTLMNCKCVARVSSSYPLSVTPLLFLSSQLSPLPHASSCFVLFVAFNGYCWYAVPLGRLRFPPLCPTWRQVLLTHFCGDFPVHWIPSALKHGAPINERWWRRTTNGPV
jgi:hypothetical protein